MSTSVTQVNRARLLSVGPCAFICVLGSVVSACADGDEPSQAEAEQATQPERATASQSLPTVRLSRAFPRLRFLRPVFRTHAGDGSNRLFVVEQAGRIRAFENGPDVKAATGLLDIKSIVRSPPRGHNEEGLLALAFHPQYRKNGHLYVYYSASRPRRAAI